MLLPILRRIHRWLGLLLALPLVVQGVTGTILTLEPLLPKATDPAVTAPAPQGANAVIAAAQAAVSGGLRPARYIPAGSAAAAAQVSFVAASGPRGRPVQVRVDPGSLAVLEVHTDPGVLEWIKALHTNLLLEGRTGRSIIGWTGVGLLALAASGIVLWWPSHRRWPAALTIDARATGHVFHRRLHGAVGAWTLVLLLTTAGTGVLLAFPQTARSALGVVEAGARRGTAQPGASTADVDRIIDRARAAVPGLRPRAVLLPGNADPVRVLLLPPGAEGAAATVTVTVDAAGSRVLSVQDPRTMPTAELLLRWAHDIHFGQGLGPAWRAITLATGLLLPVFAVTGAAMWLYRRQRPAAVLQPGE